MRLILIILTIVVITSCNSQNKKTGDMKSTYNSWQKSFLNSVTKESSLLDYQKENLLEVSKKISSSDFIKLKQLLTNKNIKVNNEYYLLELSGGEVITAYLYYVIDTGKQYQLVAIDIYSENKLIKLNKTDSDIKKLINVRPINNETLNNKLFVLTKVNNNKVSTIIGSE